MINITEDIVNDLKSLNNANPGPYVRLLGWMDTNFSDLNDALNHLDPSPDDANFNERFHYRRGFVAALDTFRNLFANPDAAIPKEKTEVVIPEYDAF